VEAENIIKMYTLIWVLLVVFTIVEVMMIAMAFPPVFILLGVIGLASLKAVFIALYYQHLKYDDIAISWFYLMALFFAIFIVIVFTGGSGVWPIQ